MLSPPTTNQTSPLLRCPPEIRNAIYDALFQFDDPLELQSLYRERNGEYSFNLPIGGINLLTVCQQTKKEASGILYSRNAFMVSCDMCLLEDWLIALGNNKTLLRQILLNLGDDTDYIPAQMDVRLILRELWLQPKATIEFTCVYRTQGSGPQTYTVAKTPNRMLAALTPAISPQIKAMVKSERTLCRAWMRDDGNSISFELQTEGARALEYSIPTIDYELSSTGQLVRVASHKPSPTLEEPRRYGTAHPFLRSCVSYCSIRRDMLHTTSTERRHPKFYQQ